MPFTARHAAPDQAPTREEIDAMPGLVALEFGTNWCPHCIAAQQLFQRALDAREDITHLKVEDGRGRPLGRSYRVKLWPTLVLLRDGQEVARLIRPRTDDELARALALLDAA
ncbi:thioredoxin family protein [Pseudoxanthomonas sp. JBR18]|uniref:thioredoxin family protein n=1 Tax=Pseudoxanthomonas sp. JBR18 TaxID=2969308 RepID=UPI002306C196|nr:thioredoxin family protein [Pseudoxanthomonas sp. JBR18]WCE06039.1 thioredoxin family protein [Pseudoxanthomonas sp. JBR18]